MTGRQERNTFRRFHGRKGACMPTEDDLERRLWRTMPWDADVMQPSEEQDAKDEKEGENN
jgi:hypothetical protein